jgi:hypothetical protein
MSCHRITDSQDVIHLPEYIDDRFSRSSTAASSVPKIIIEVPAMSRWIISESDRPATVIQVTHCPEKQCIPNSLHHFWYVIHCRLLGISSKFPIRGNLLGPGGSGKVWIGCFVDRLIYRYSAKESADMLARRSSVDISATQRGQLDVSIALFIYARLA